MIVHEYTGLLHRNNKKHTTDCHTTSVYLKCIMLNEWRLTQKTTYYMIPLYDTVEKGKLSGEEIKEWLIDMAGFREGVDKKENFLS